MIREVTTHAEWVSRQTKCKQCMYQHEQTCAHIPCFPNDRKSGNQIDVYYVEDEE